MAKRGRSNDQAIAALANRMLTRYLDRVALAGGSRQETTKRKREKQPPEDPREVETSVVLVLGAAASYLSGMPAWQSLYEEGLLGEIEKVFSRREVMVDELWSKLSPYIGPRPEPALTDLLTALTQRTKVEQILGVASELVPARRQILDVLQKHYGAGSLAPPQLGYELIAHLLRHGFLDHVITFNFDEVLDAAIENELERDGFVRIISDTDLPSTTKAADRPSYLKLHGTISVPESLRFTKEQTQTLSPEMLRLLDKTVFRKPRIHLVTIGYSWNDDDFVQWVVARMDRIERVTIVRNGRDVPPLLDERFASRRAIGQPSGLREKVDIVSMQAVARRLGIEQPFADHLLLALVNGIEAELTRREEPFVPAARHVVLSLAFYPQRAGTDTERPWKIGQCYNTHDAKSRLRMELWLQLVKSKGMLNLSVLARTPRIHRYWAQCADLYPHKPPLIDHFMPQEIQPSSHGEVKETYFSTLHSGEDVIASMMADFRWPRLATTVPTITLASSTPKLSRQRIDTEELVHLELTRIWAGEEVEVLPSPDPRAEWLFHDPKPVTSYLALRKKTLALLHEDWTHLFVVAESGSWLLEGGLATICGAPETPRTILLIVASDEGLEDWKAWNTIRRELKERMRSAPAGVRVLEMSIPWWQHNRHLSLALRMPSARVNLLGGIYFRRRLKDSRVAPVVVDKEIDKVELLLIFLAYVVRAAEHRWNRHGALSDQDEQFIQHAVAVLVAAKTNPEQRRRSKAIRSRLADLRRGAPTSSAAAVPPPATTHPSPSRKPSGRHGRRSGGRSGPPRRPRRPPPDGG